MAETALATKEWHGKFDQCTSLQECAEYRTGYWGYSADRGNGAVFLGGLLSRGYGSAVYRIRTEMSRLQ